jgi:thioredoxin-like negative regulator of GroEL
LLFAAGFAAFTYFSCAFALRRMDAMRLYEVGSSSAIEAALVKDPGSYRIRMRAADFYLSKGNCSKARSNALVARDLFPSSPGPRHVLTQCPGR